MDPASELAARKSDADLSEHFHLMLVATALNVFIEHHILLFGFGVDDPQPGGRCEFQRKLIGMIDTVIKLGVESLIFFIPLKSITQRQGVFFKDLFKNQIGIREFCRSRQPNLAP